MKHLSLLSLLILFALPACNRDRPTVHQIDDQPPMAAPKPIVEEGTAPSAALDTRDMEQPGARPAGDRPQRADAGVAAPGEERAHVPAEGTIGSSDRR